MKGGFMPRPKKSGDRRVALARELAALSPNSLRLVTEIADTMRSLIPQEALAAVVPEAMARSVKFVPDPDAEAPARKGKKKPGPKPGTKYKKKPGPKPGTPKAPPKAPKAPTPLKVKPRGKKPSKVALAKALLAKRRANEDEPQPAAPSTEVAHAQDDDY